MMKCKRRKHILQIISVIHREHLESRVSQCKSHIPATAEYFGHELMAQIYVSLFTDFSFCYAFLLHSLYRHFVRHCTHPPSVLQSVGFYFCVFMHLLTGTYTTILKLHYWTCFHTGVLVKTISVNFRCLAGNCILRCLRKLSHSGNYNFR